MKASYQEAKKIYGDIGVDIDKAVCAASQIPVSIHCWQGDDLTGLISGVDNLSSGGIMATGDFLGKARTGDQLRSDLDKVFGHVPGAKRLNLHSVYAEPRTKIGLEDISVEHFDKWIKWAGDKKCGLDFNPTCFSHPMADSGYTLSSADDKVRRFWIEHVQNCRSISAEFGKKQGSASMLDIWIPDGAKDTTIDKSGYRRRLKESLDEILAKKYSSEVLIDAVESKLFGLGSESFVVGSYDFYLQYAATRKIALCLDLGHFHPTESVADKISSLLEFGNKFLLHTSRGVRWDSDHVATMSDETVTLMQEINRCGAFDKFAVALDYFDASINRIYAWIVGARATKRAMLYALCEPVELLKTLEKSGKYGARLALLEELKSFPFQAVWEQFCDSNNTSAGREWFADVDKYEETVLRKR